MARYGFTSPAAVIHSGLQDLMAQRALEQQREAEAQQKAADLVLRQAAEKRTAEMSAEALKGAKQNRVKGAIEAVGKGGALDPSLVTEAGQVGLSGMTEGAAPAIAQPVAPVTDPTQQQGIFPGIIATSAPSVGDAAAAPGRVSRGTATERAAATKEEAIKAAGTALEGVTDRQEAMRRVLKAGVSTADADGVINTYMGKEKFQDTPMRWDPKDGTLEALGVDGKWSAHKGPLPEHYKILNEKDAAAMGGGLSTKLFTDSTGTFLAKTDASGNTVLERVGGLRPFAGQAQTITRGAAALTTAEAVKNMVNPDWLGPLKGRYNSMATAYTDTMGPQGFAFFDAQVNTMKNQAIKAITGAQMSEPEAVRIMKALPDVNLPPVAFATRMDSFMQDLATATTIEQMYAEGRKDEAFDLRIKNFGADPTGTAQAATEERLQKLFPKVSVKTGNQPPTNTGTPAVFSPSAPNAPKGKSKYQVTVQ